MRRWARFLHILLCAPAPLLAAAVTTPVVAHAATAPTPYVVTIDPGHGGAPNNADPSQTYDSGAIGLDGLVEKDVTLDVSMRLRAMLEQDGVRVVMTRTSDQDVTIEQRSAIANAAHSDLFVSVHFNSFTDPSVGGSLILYPKGDDIPFAKALDSAQAKDLGPWGVPDDGVQLRDDWWLSIQAPVVTVESAYLTNAHEAQLLTRDDFRDAVARSIKDGIEAYKPDILARKQQLAAAGALPTPAAAVAGIATHNTASPAAQSGESFFTTLFHWALFLGIAALLVRFRVQVWWLIRVLYGITAWAVHHSTVHRNAQRRRRQAVRRRALAAQAARTARPHSVYDELWF